MKVRDLSSMINFKESSFITVVRGDDVSIINKSLLRKISVKITLLDKPLVVKHGDIDKIIIYFDKTPFTYNVVKKISKRNLFNTLEFMILQEIATCLNSGANVTNLDECIEKVI